MKVTIIGAGNMGRGIGTRAVAGGHEVEIVDNDPADAEALASDLGDSATAVAKGSIGGDIVVLAVYYPSTLTAVEEYGDQLAGRVVVDIANPIDFETMDGLAVAPDTSSAEETAKRVPSGTPVVKAFNTVFATTLVKGEVAGQKIDVFIAGDDDAAKQKVASLVESGGLRPIDVGPLRRARQLEQFEFLHVAIQEPLSLGYSSTIKLLP
jgi:8-hydroxy-5-deazaflavin:NADPH oxidoreductase